MVNSYAKAFETLADHNAEAHCSQAVLLSCLYLSHEMVLREVGMYAWTFPAVKDPTGSMMKIMKGAYPVIVKYT